MKMIRVLAGAMLVAAVAACGSASDNISFQAPPSYHSKASIGPFMQIWQGPKTNDMIMLMSFPVQMDLNKMMSQSDVKNAQIERHEDMTICHDQRAVYLEMRGESTVAQSKQSQTSEIQYIATNAQGKTYMAMYLRPLNSPVDRAASASIRNLCPK